MYSLDLKVYGLLTLMLNYFSPEHRLLYQACYLLSPKYCRQPKMRNAY